MAKGKREVPPCSKTYGFPIYGAAWVPMSHPEVQKPKSEEDEKEESSELISKSSSSSSSCLVFSGGGGEGNSGIKNSLLIAQFDSSTNSLSPTPVSKLDCREDLPYRMAVHPRGAGVICSFPEHCRFFEWDGSEKAVTNTLGLKSPGEILPQLENVGQQLSLTFSFDGSLLAVGGEDGYLRVFKWPSMDLILDRAKAYSRLKDLSFSSDAKFLVSLGAGGSCTVWDMTLSTIAATLAKENDEIFAFCRFPQSNSEKQILYIVTTGGTVLLWDTTSWERVGTKHIVRDPISAFNVSADGKFLSVGTIQGDIIVMNTANMRVLTVVRNAHLGLVTSLMFSLDSRYLVSASLDSYARVTPVEVKKKQSGLNMWIIIFIVLLAILVYFFKEKGFIPN